MKQVKGVSFLLLTFLFIESLMSLHRPVLRKKGIKIGQVHLFQQGPGVGSSSLPLPLKLSPCIYLPHTQEPVILPSFLSAYLLLKICICFASRTVLGTEE